MTVSDPHSGPEQQYFAALAEGKFRIQKCSACGRHVFYPRVSCPHCGAKRLEWVAASGRGTVYSVTTVRRKPEAGGDYNVSLVDLEEGPRLMSRIDGVAPAQVRIGMAVEARVAMEGSSGVLTFFPAGAAR